MTQFEQDSQRERGRILDGLFAHYCNDWDGMTVDETCAEISCCNCTFLVADGSEGDDGWPCAEVPEEVKQYARDYYDALDPFSEMDPGKRADILCGNPHPFDECENIGGSPCKDCIDFSVESVGAMAVSS